MRFEDEGSFLNGNTDSDLKLDEYPSEFDLGAPDPEFLISLFGEFGDPSLGCSGDPYGLVYQPDLPLGELGLGVQALAGGDDPGPVEAVAKNEKAVYGTGIEAKKLRAVNVKSGELVSYKKSVEALAGRPLYKRQLQHVADLVRDQYHVTVGRVGRRGLWSLWAFIKKQFPDPADFVAFLA